MDWNKIETLKEQGKESIHVKNYDDSLKCYKDAVELVGSGYKSFALVVHSNIAQAYLKKKNYSSAVEHANKSLELDPLFRKSMLRRATANTELQNYEEAMKDLRYLFEYEPTNPQVISLRRCCRPKMKQELRICYVSYYFRKALQKSCQNYEAPLEYRLADGNLAFSLLRQMLLSLKNSEFVSQLLSGVCVSPCLSLAQLILHNWFGVQIIKLKLPFLQRIMLSARMFKILFHLAQSKTFILILVMPSDENMFGPWNRYSGIYYWKGTKELSLTINANDLRVIEQNSEMWTRLSYLPMIKFKNCRFTNLKDLLFYSETSADMEFLKLWQKKQWLIERLIFYEPEPKLENFKRFEGIISNHLTTLYIWFGKVGIPFTKKSYYDLSNDLAAFKRVFPSLTEVNMTANCSVDITKFSLFIQGALKKVILDAITAINYKPEWCSNLRFLIDISIHNTTVSNIGNITLETVKNAVESFRHELDCVKNLHFVGPSISKFNYHSYCPSLFTLLFETDAAYFEIEFMSFL